MYLFFVVEFEDAATADDGIDALQERVVFGTLIPDADEVSFPMSGDETRAFIGETSNDGFEFTVGVVLVRNGRFVFLYLAAALLANVAGDLVPFVEMIPENLDATYTDRGLLGILPRLSDMPAGYRIEDEGAFPINSDGSDE